MLIIEGSDLVGKTTLQSVLVNRLAEHGPWIPAHLSLPPKMWQSPSSYFQHMSRYVVQDRFHMSEIAYAFAARGGKTRLTPYRYSLVDAKLRQLGGYTVVIIADKAFLREQWKGCNREEMYGLDVILRANEEFEQICVTHEVDVDIVIRCDNGFPAKQTGVIDYIVQKYLQRQEELDAVLRQDQMFHPIW